LLDDIGLVVVVDGVGLVVVVVVVDDDDVALVVTFRVSRRRREMYCGHTRRCVCVCPRPHAHTIVRTRMQLGGVVGDAS